MGVTLANVIETNPTRALSRANRKQLFEEKRDVEALGRYHHREDDSIEKAINKHVTTGAKLAMDGHSLPKGTAAFDILIGRSTVRTARDLAERIGFGIFPWSLIRQPYAPPSREAEALRQWKSAGYPIYIMAPVQAYDLKDHIEHPDWTKPMFVPSDARQAFMALSMSIPVFRSLQEQINSLRSQIRDYYERMQSLERDVRQLNERVTVLGREIAEVRVQQAAIEQDRRREQVMDWYGSISDPLALILPLNTTIEKLDAPLLVGPAWGGDLPAEIAKLLGRKTLPKSRK